MTRIILGISAILAAASNTCAQAPTAGKVELVNADFAALQKAIDAHKGKVVIVDVWADFCLPCKKKFPHIVELSKTHAKDGLVVITVSVDELDKKANALAFLKKNDATFQNFLLDDTDENKEKWEKKLAHTSPPILHVFDRGGKLVKTFEFEEAKVVDKFIEETIKAK